MGTRDQRGSCRDPMQQAGKRKGTLSAPRYVSFSETRYGGDRGARTDSRPATTPQASWRGDGTPPPPGGRRSRGEVCLDCPTIILEWRFTHNGYSEDTEFIWAVIRDGGCMISQRLEYRLGCMQRSPCGATHTTTPCGSFQTAVWHSSAPPVKRVARINSTRLSGSFCKRL